MNFEKHCWAEIDLDALRHNFALIRHTVGVPVCAVVKADAYGHGAETVAPALEKAGAAAFAVSCLAEARYLRAAGIQAPILILGYCDPTRAAQIAACGAVQALYSTEYAQALSAAAAAAGCTVRCHIKVDTGMGRIGFCLRSNFERAIGEIEACYSLPGIAVAGVFQHFAAADSTEPQDLAYTAEQHGLFRRAVERLRADGFEPGTVHSSNSAAQMLYPTWRHDMVRAGIILYGLSPSEQVVFPALRPAMSLKAVVTYVKELLPGQSVSYGRTFCNETGAPMQVATVSVGYADGYPRLLSNRGVMLLRGRPAPVVGRVCMDQTLVNVTGIPEAAMGDEVTVFGPAGQAVGADTADAVARKAGTIHYEIVCGITRRVPRAYLENGGIAAVSNCLEVH